MDTLPLTQKSPVLTSDAGQKLQAVTQPAGSETTQTTQAVQAADKPVASELSTEQLEEMAGQMESFIGSFNRGLKFRVDEDSGRSVVTVVDNHSGDIIRQIPSEELLDVITRLAEASGGLIDTKA
ncbi:MAG: flagellar biosynthesis protein FlaG [Gammaproteobacteria bacterium]|nr:flagellar biosynthesis protein FlaG [Gammaproteobacteria bacterium]